MHFHVVDAYQDTGSRLHLIDARAKLVMATILILLISLTPQGAFGAYVAFFTIAMAGAVYGQIDPGMVIRRSMIVLPFAGAAITLIFTIPGHAVATMPLTGWTISQEGILRFASILFKSTISVMIAVVLMATTHFTEMLWAMGALKMPQILVAIISFMYRYLFVLGDEALRLTRARDSRSASLQSQKQSGVSLLFQARTTGRMIGSLFLRSFERSERVYQAMAARGFKGQIKRLSPPVLRPVDIFTTGLVLLAGIIILSTSVVFR